MGDLWSVPAYLRMCAPWLAPSEVKALQRKDTQAWTVSDLPLLDAARRRLGDPEASRQRRWHEAAVTAEREQMAQVVEHLIETDDSEMVVDEAQELTDAESQMLLARCPSRSFTIVGDRAQARHGFTQSWQERLERVGLGRSSLATLSHNYRTPEEVMAEAEPAIREALPDANVPTSIRSNGLPVVQGPASDLGSVSRAQWTATSR